MENQNQEKCDHCRNECCGELHAEIIINRSSEIIIEKSRKKCNCEVSEFQKNESSYKAYTKKCKNSEDSTFETIINKEDCYKSEHIYPPGGNECDEKSSEVATRNSSASGEDKVDVYKVINKELKHRIKGVTEDTVNPVTKNSSEANVVNVERDETLKLNGKSKSRSLDDKKLTEYLKDGVKADEKTHQSQKSQESTRKQKKTLVKEKRETHKEKPKQDTSEIEEQAYAPRRVRDTINRLNRLSESNQENVQYDQKLTKRKKPPDFKFKPDIPAWSYLNSENEKARSITMDVEEGQVIIENMKENEIETNLDTNRINGMGLEPITRKESERDIVANDEHKNILLNDTTKSDAKIDISKNVEENSILKSDSQSGNEDSRERNNKKKRASKEKKKGKSTKKEILSPVETNLSSGVLDDSQEAKKSVNNQLDEVRKMYSESRQKEASSESHEPDIPPKNMVKSIIQFMEMRHRELSEDRNRSRDSSLEPKERTRRNTRDSSKEKFEEGTENTFRNEKSKETAKTSASISSNESNNDKQSSEKQFENETITDHDVYGEDINGIKVSSLMKRFETDDMEEINRNEKNSSIMQNIELEYSSGDEEGETEEKEIVIHSTDQKENVEKNSNEGNLTFKTVSQTIDTVIHTGAPKEKEITDTKDEKETGGQYKDSVDNIETIVGPKGEQSVVEKLDSKDNGKSNEYVDYIIEVIKDPLNLSTSNNNVFDAAFRNTNKSQIINDVELRQSLVELEDVRNMDEDNTDDDIDSPFIPTVRDTKDLIKTEQISDVGEDVNESEKILHDEDSSINKSFLDVEKTSQVTASDSVDMDEHITMGHRDSFSSHTKSTQPDDYSIQVESVKQNNDYGSTDTREYNIPRQEETYSEQFKCEKTIVSSSISSNEKNVNKDSSEIMQEYSKKSSDKEETLRNVEEHYENNEKIEYEKENYDGRKSPAESNENDQDYTSDSKRERKNTLEKIKIERSVEHLSNSTETVEKCFYESYRIESNDLSKTEAMSDSEVQQEPSIVSEGDQSKNTLKTQSDYEQEPSLNVVSETKHVSFKPVTEDAMSSIDIAETNSSEKIFETDLREGKTENIVGNSDNNEEKHSSEYQIDKSFSETNISDVDVVVESEKKLQENTELENKISIPNTSMESLRKKRTLEGSPYQNEKSNPEMAEANSNKDETNHSKDEAKSSNDGNSSPTPEHSVSTKQIILKNDISHAEIENLKTSSGDDTEIKNNEGQENKVIGDTESNIIDQMEGGYMEDGTVKLKEHKRDFKEKTICPHEESLENDGYANIKNKDEETEDPKTPPSKSPSSKSNTITDEDIDGFSLNPNEDPNRKIDVNEEKNLVLEGEKNYEKKAEINTIQDVEETKELANVEDEETDEGLEHSTRKTSNTNKSEEVINEIVKTHGVIDDDSVDNAVDISSKMEEELNDLRNIIKKYHEDVEIIIVENNEDDSSINSTVTLEEKQTDVIIEHVEINEENETSSLEEIDSRIKSSPTEESQSDDGDNIFGNKIENCLSQQTKNTILSKHELLMTQEEEKDKLADEVNECLEEEGTKLKSVEVEIKEFFKTPSEDNDHGIQRNNQNTDIVEHPSFESNKEVEGVGRELQLQNDDNGGIQSLDDDKPNNTANMTNDNELHDYPKHGFLSEEEVSIAENENNIDEVIVSHEKTITSDLKDKDSKQMVGDRASHEETISSDPKEKDSKQMVEGRASHEETISSDVKDKDSKQMVVDRASHEENISSDLEDKDSKQMVGGRVSHEETMTTDYKDNNSKEMVGDRASRLPRSVEHNIEEIFGVDEVNETNISSENLNSSGNEAEYIETDKISNAVVENDDSTDTDINTSLKSTILNKEDNHKSPVTEILKEHSHEEKEIITDIKSDGKSSELNNHKQKNENSLGSSVKSQEMIETLRSSSLFLPKANQLHQGGDKTDKSEDEDETTNEVNLKPIENTHEIKMNSTKTTNTGELNRDIASDKGSKQIDESKEKTEMDRNTLRSKYTDVNKFISTERQYDVHDNDSNKDSKKLEFKDVSNMVKNIEDITLFLQKESKREEHSLEEDDVLGNSTSNKYIETNKENKSSNISCNDNLGSDNFQKVIEDGSKNVDNFEPCDEVDRDNDIRNVEDNVKKSEHNFDKNIPTKENVGNTEESSTTEQNKLETGIERSNNVSFIDIIDGHDNGTLHREHFENTSKCVLDNSENESISVEKTWDAEKDEMKLDISHTFDDTENKNIHVVAHDEDYPNISVQIKISYNTAEEKGSLDQKFTLNNKEDVGKCSEPIDDEKQSDLKQKRADKESLPKTDITCLKKSTYTCIEENFENDSVVKNVLKKKTNIINDQNLLRNKDSKITEVMRKIESFDAFEDPKSEHHIGKLTMKKHTMREVKSFEYQEIYDGSKENLHQFQRKRTGRKKLIRRSVKNSKDENSSEDSKHTDSDTSSIEHELIISEPPSKENKDGSEWRLQGMSISSNTSIAYPSKSRNIFPRSSYYNATDACGKHLMEDKMNNESYQMNLDSYQDLNIKNKNKPIQKIKNKTRTFSNNKFYEDHLPEKACAACAYVEDNRPRFITTVKKGMFLEPPRDIAAMLGLAPKESTSESRNNVVYSFSSKPRLCQHKRENLKSELCQG